MTFRIRDADALVGTLWRVRRLVPVLSLVSPRGRCLLEIELDAFSGRPNPRWDLTEAQEPEFLKLLRGLGPAQGHPHWPSQGLGYRGFIIRSQREAADSYNEVRVFRGTVLARRGEHAETFSDPERVLEGWMLDSAREHLSEPVLQYVKSEIER